MTRGIIMTRSTAAAYSNIAFVKYWGNADFDLNIPANNSISMNLSGARTVTSVESGDPAAGDEYFLDGKPLDPASSFAAKITDHLDLLRTAVGTNIPLRVETANSFPESVGLASSASGFAALTMAAAKALGLDLDKRHLSMLARRGSGSACRSIPAGFVEWHAGEDDENSFAEQIAPETHWDLVDLAVIVSSQKKTISSAAGHQLAAQSPFWRARQAVLPERLNKVRRAILEHDFETLGQETESEALSLHAVALTSPHELQGSWSSGVYYWDCDTMGIMKSVQSWRMEGLPVYFTLDAGPTVHLLCEAGNAPKVRQAVEKFQGDRNWQIVENAPAGGAHLLD
jgi:diphosphomevalonate decarboxylase